MPVDGFIKSETNVQSSAQPVPTQRLTSFRLPRDLTLGGNIKLEKPKKVYTPNVNVQRNKKKKYVILVDDLCDYVIIRVTPEIGVLSGFSATCNRYKG